MAMEEGNPQSYTTRSQDESNLHTMAEPALPNDITVELDGVQYLIHPKPIAELEILHLPSDLNPQSISALPESNSRQATSWLPVTVINSSDRLFSDNTCVPRPYLEDELQKMQELDDVLIDTFTQTVICLIPSDAAPALTPISSECKSSRKVRFAKSRQDEELYSAPYFLQGDHLYKAYRLYPDTYGAFISGIFESIPGHLEEALGSTHQESALSSLRDLHKTNGNLHSYQEIQSNLIPIPSRLYSHQPGSNPQKPLSGQRIAIKDIFHICGLKTGAGSKDYRSLSQPATYTAEAVQALIDAGAVLVGKTKTVSFASGAAAADWTEYECPINPRGDGRLDPDCSSTGSGVAMAGYEWLDFSIGSDSLGSMVGPAAANGVFGFRPTHGLPFPPSAKDGILVSRLLDTVGHFSRSLPGLEILARAWFPGSKLESGIYRGVRRILVHPELTTGYEQKEDNVIKDFILDFERIVGLSAESFDLGASVLTPLDESYPGMKWSEYLSNTMANIQLYDSYHNSLGFDQQFRDRFNSSPSLEPIVAYKRELARETVSKAMYEDECSRMEKFREYIQTEIIVAGTVMLLPIIGVKPSFIDTQPSLKALIAKQDARPWTELLGERGRRWQGFGFRSTAVSVLGGLPCVSFPVGETPYDGKSGAQENTFNRPINLMIVGAPRKLSLIYDD
ncbi:hypothetical protein BP5796_01894 [Coleophoma crateriformis]|uniref:Amidase domain-containing protein n=1 Tax=Coleophoma crateriformis TaxID=565419 RepID=A0A3D8T1U3_9HELO|nr:hypothetical protein BP5796_01894 [Coleophoma crateriformis]